MVDNYDMSTGGTNFGADVSIPGMKIAVVARAPVYRGKVKSYDATEALGIQGVERVVEIPALPDEVPAEYHALGGVAVVGTNTWSVLEGRRKLSKVSSSFIPVSSLRLAGGDERGFAPPEATDPGAEGLTIGPGRAYSRAQGMHTPRTDGA